MKIVNKLEIIAVVTLLSLGFSHQSALSQNNDTKQLEKVKNQDNKIVVTELANRDTLLVSSQQLLHVNDSSIILPIPQPLGIFCLLGMAGVGSLLKLKIAKAKYEKRLEEKVETSNIEDKSVQMLNH